MDAAFAAPGEAGGTTRFDLALLVRIGVAVALAFPIGWEREFRGSEAGDRTFMLVSLGAAAFTAVGVENFPATAEKVMAGVVTGVGFLGGGMICQSALEWDPLSASKRDPFDRRVLLVALASSELVGVAETARARVV